MTVLGILFLDLFNWESMRHSPIFLEVISKCFLVCLGSVYVPCTLLYCPSFLLRPTPLSSFSLSLIPPFHHALTHFLTTRLASRAAAQDIRAKLHGRTIRGYSARLGVSFADDLNASCERESELSPGQESESGPESEYGFGFEGGGVSVYGPDGGGGFDAYGTSSRDGEAYNDGDAYHASNLYGYSDADATVTGTDTGNAKTMNAKATSNANRAASANPNAPTNVNAAAMQKMSQQPIVSGLPGPASEGYSDPFYEGFEGDGNAFSQNDFGCGLGNGKGEWVGNYGASESGNLGYGQRQLLNQGLGIGMGSGPGLGTAEQVQHLLQVRNQLQFQNQLLNAAPMAHCTSFRFI